MTHPPPSSVFARYFYNSEAHARFKSRIKSITTQASITVIVIIASHCQGRNQPGFERAWGKSDLVGVFQDGEEQSLYKTYDAILHVSDTIITFPAYDFVSIREGRRIFLKE